MFRIKELRERILFTVTILAVFRFGSVLTIPGIDPHALTVFFKSQLQGNAFVDYMDFFAGGAFSNFSVFMLGVMPYISTQILMQLALIIFPSLKKAAEEDGGRKRIQSWTRFATIGVALIQSYAVTVYASSIPNAIVIDKLAYTLIAMLTVTTGTMVTVWLGEQITGRGIGNGISMLIFAGIVARLPTAAWELVKLVQTGDVNPVFVILALIMFVGIIALVVYEQQGQRKIPVHYAKRVVGRKMYGGQNTYIPFKINPSGVRQYRSECPLAQWSRDVPPAERYLVQRFLCRIDRLFRLFLHAGNTEPHRNCETDPGKWRLHPRNQDRQDGRIHAADPESTDSSRFAVSRGDRGVADDHTEPFRFSPVHLDVDGRNFSFDPCRRRSRHDEPDRSPAQDASS